METKTYFASSVPAALDLARKELGNDAMLVGSRQAPKDARMYGRLEVTFAYEAKAANAGKTDRQVTGPLKQGLEKQGSELGEIREELAALRSAIRTSPLGAGGQDPSVRIVDGIVGRLERSGLSEETARQIAEAAVLRPEPTDLAVRNELQKSIRVRPFVPMKPGESRTLAFFGPTGRGKSSSLVKIAVRHGLAAKIPTRIYSAGVHQVGAAEQMARYAAILGVPFSWHETLEGLHLALNGEKWKGLCLIDTPGISPADVEEIAGWERIFRVHPEIERHLVLRADARCADISSMVSRLECLGPTHLLFTGLDEVADFGVLIETAILSQLALCFAGSGPRVPEDLATVDAVALVRSVWATQAIAAAA